MKEKRINHRGHRGKINSLCSPKSKIKCRVQSEKVISEWANEKKKR